MNRLSMVLCLILTAVIASEAWAKRGAPKPVTPVFRNGVKYVAANENGREGKIEARDEKTGKKLWDVVIYTIKIDPNLEEDVQWAFITGLAVRDDTLMVTNEKNEQFALHIAKLAQRQFKARPPSDTKPTTRQRYGRLIAGAIPAMTRYLKSPNEETKSKLWEMHQRARDAQDRVEHQQWGDVRIIECWELLIVETAWVIPRNRSRGQGVIEAARGSCSSTDMPSTSAPSPATARTLR